MTTRDYWIHSLLRISDPVLRNLAAGTLRKNMPVESTDSISVRSMYVHLEVFGRLMAGIAPWLELNEGQAAPVLALAREALDRATDPRSPDYCNFSEGAQPLVDASFLAQAILRAPKELWESIDSRVQDNLVAALRQTRQVIPGRNNWILFSATIEAAFYRMGVKDWDSVRIAYAFRQHEQWYKGDGCYGDGAEFHMDYYNSFVIQPMLVDIARAVGSEIEELKRAEEKILARSRRYAAIQERMISPEGTFPPLGRSITYRFGVMQTLAQMALLRQLPEEVSPGQVREALTAVLRRFMEAPAIFDPNGWLRVGFGGHQPELGEKYISTGSLYLFAFGFLPLGLPAEDPFWSSPAAPWTSVKAWSGMETPIDHALHSA